MPALLGAPQLLALWQSHSIPRRGSCPHKESLSLLPCFCSLTSSTQPNKLLCSCPIQLLTGSEDCPQAPAHPETLPMACVMWCILCPAGQAGVCLDIRPLPKLSTTEADVDRDLLSLLQGLLPALLQGGWPLTQPDLGPAWPCSQAAGGSRRACHSPPTLLPWQVPAAWPKITQAGEAERNKRNAAQLLGTQHPHLLLLTCSRSAQAPFRWRHLCWLP